ncbi:PRC-barrel domain-containing protein [Paramicrobacterium agarici]|uniref:PRC-barrel domain-containing protein n=1 Tax=Paramicrobacterium agarici TaxID=630514 RepID=UPI00114E1D58|nr:PRC-barrel domain-containing protein [Microbacterium agarici]TQO22693.1 PRC-barrel domain protein [Microbacterium agarici]
MATNEASKLIKLSDTQETITSTDEDIRNYDVKDREGADLGKVDDLLIDPDENKVRFMEVASGGFLGIGQDKSFIPVDAITGISEDEVRIDQTRSTVAGAPAYDPELVNDTSYYNEVFGYYGYSPYWTPGYAYPAFPYYRYA